MSPAVKIRGIYATALTRFLMDSGVSVVFPSRRIADRFGGTSFSTAIPDVEIQDTVDGQGIRLVGDPGGVEEIIQLFRKELVDAVVRRTDQFPPAADAEVEFPFLSKCALDAWRHRVLPTVFHHHRFKLIHSDFVDLVEQKDLYNHPERRKSISRDLRAKLIWDAYAPNRDIAIEHVKLDGRTIYLSEGTIIDIQRHDQKLILKRSQFKGRSTYDGLGVPKNAGDYAVTEAAADSWHYRHTYFRETGEVIGTYVNINTPVEFYPEKIRYVDLEVDVVRWPDGRAKTVDEGKLKDRYRAGFITENLRDTALTKARELMAKVSTEPELQR